MSTVIDRPLWDSNPFGVFPLAQALKIEGVDELPVRLVQQGQTAAQLTAQDVGDGGVLHADRVAVRDHLLAGQLRGVQPVIGDGAVALVFFSQGAATPLFLVIGKINVLGDLDQGSGDVYIIFYK